MPSRKDNSGMKRSRLRLRSPQVLVLALLIVLWHVLTSPTLLPPIYFTEANQAAFFFGEPIQVFARLWRLFAPWGNFENLWVARFESASPSFFSPLSPNALSLCVLPLPHP